VEELTAGMSGRGRAALELRLWAEEQGMEVVALRACGRPPDSVVDQFPNRWPQAYGPWLRTFKFRYFEVVGIDDDHVRRSGIARVRSESHTQHFDIEPVIDFVWLTSEQLDWRDQPPRRSAQSPHDHAEGWYADHTGAHELRWYSVGTPTDLVKDGAIETRDPPDPLTEFRD
jgi:hypothetical protein